MIKFPEVSHKIPELFRLIIENDRLLSLIRADATPSFLEYKTRRERRRELSRAAQEFITKQKSGK